MAWRDWIRTVEIEPSLYGADFANLGSQIEQLMAAGCRIFHFDVGDGHFVEPITMGPIVLQSIAPLIHARGGVIDVHLMVENPVKYFEPVASAGGDSVTFHYEAVEDVPAAIRAARELEIQVGVAFNPESEPEDVAAVSGAADLVLCMGDSPRLLGPGVHGDDLRPRAPAARCACRRGLHPGGRGCRRRQHQADSRLRRDPARRRDRDLRARGLASRLPPARSRARVSLARAIELARAARHRAYPKPTVGAVLVREGRNVGEGATEAAGPPCRDRCARRRPERTRAVRRCT